jgi:hypothetical protein
MVDLVCDSPPPIVTELQYPPHTLPLWHKAVHPREEGLVIK